MDAIFAALEKFASFLFGLDEEAGNWVSKIVAFAKEILGSLEINF